MFVIGGGLTEGLRASAKGDADTKYIENLRRKLEREEHKEDDLFLKLLEKKVASL